MVWPLMRYLVTALFLAGHDYVLLDGTNVKKRRRDQWISPKWQRKFLVSPLDAYECQQRADKIQDPILREQLQDSVYRAVQDYEEVDELTEGEIIPWEYASDVLCATS